MKLMRTPVTTTTEEWKTASRAIVEGLEAPECQILRGFSHFDSRKPSMGNTVGLLNHQEFLVLHCKIMATWGGM